MHLRAQAEARLGPARRRKWPGRVGEPAAGAPAAQARRAARFSLSLGLAPTRSRTAGAGPGFPASHAATERPQSPKPTDLTALGSLPAITTARALRIAPQAPPQPPGPPRSSLKRRGHGRAPGDHWPAPPLRWGTARHTREPVDFDHRHETPYVRDKPLTVRMSGCADACASDAYT